MSSDTVNTPDTTGNVVDPVAISAANDDNGNNGNDGDAGQPRKRGRPRGSGNKAKPLPLNVNGLEKLLVSFHAMAAAFVSPALALDSTSKDFDGKSEAGFLAQSIVDVARHYNVGMLDQKAVDWINLIQALGMVYGTRLFAMRAMRQPKKAAPAPAPFPAPPPAQHHPQPQAAAGVPPFGRDITQERPAPPNDTAVRTGEIPGVGAVEFPPDHPLTGGRKLN